MELLLEEQCLKLMEHSAWHTVMFVLLTEHHLKLLVIFVTPKPAHLMVLLLILTMEFLVLLQQFDQQLLGFRVAILLAAQLLLEAKGGAHPAAAPFRNVRARAGGRQICAAMSSTKAR